VHIVTVDKVSTAPWSVIQHAGIFRITRDAVPYMDIRPHFAHSLIIRVFALVDCAIEVELLLLGTQFLLVAGTTDAIPFLELLRLVVLKALDQVTFGRPDRILAGGIATDYLVMRG
jgi:hypothetical protein